MARPLGCGWSACHAGGCGPQRSEPARSDTTAESENTSTLWSAIESRLLDPRRRRLHVAVIALALIVHLSTHYATYVPALRQPLGSLPYFRLHVLHEAEFLAIIAYAGVVLGLRSGLVAVAFTAVTSVPFILTPYIFDRAPRANEIRDLAIQTVAVLLMGVFITVLYDRDKRRRAAEAHATSLREVDRVRNNFVSMAAHELRSPLTSVAGFTDLLLRRDPPPAQRKAWLESIREEGARLGHLIDELLSVARIEAGTLSVDHARVQLLAAFNAATNSVGESSLHAFVMDVPAGLPPVLADQAKLQQVLVNLLSNALKYSPTGGDITISARNTGDGFVQVEVADTGLGISEEDQEKLFTSFYRVRTDETAEIGGTGLGLFIVKSLVELMGGRATLRSAAGEGSVFGFTLPVWSEGAVPGAAA